MTTRSKGPVKAVEFPENTREMTVAHGMLRLVRDELVHRIDAVEERCSARDAESRTEIAMLHAKLDGLHRKIDAKFDMLSHEMHAGFEVMQAMMARHLAIAEDQARQNSIVMVALHGVIQRLDRVERERSDAREPTVTPSRPRRTTPRKKR